MEDIWDEAVKAGTNAADACNPAMSVCYNADLLGNRTGPNSAPFPVCGFAWVKVSPGNCRFANWLKKNEYARASYSGGVDVWITHGGQSMELKMKYADAMSKVFGLYGINSYSDSRMD